MSVADPPLDLGITSSTENPYGSVCLLAPMGMGRPHRWQLVCVRSTAAQARRRAWVFSSGLRAISVGSVWSVGGR